MIALVAPGAPFAPEVAQRRGLLAALESLRVELDRDLRDHSQLTEQLRIWHGRFLAALLRRDIPEERIAETYIRTLFNDVRVPEGPHRMLQPLVDFLQRNHIPVPQEFERPSPEQIAAHARAARVEAFRARQQRYRPVEAPVEPARLDPVLAGRITEEQERAAALDQRIVAVEARMREGFANAEQRIQGLNDHQIPALRGRVDHVQEDQRAADQDLAQTQANVQALERDVAETKQALKDKQKDSLGGALVALGTILACVAINSMLSGQAAFTFDGKWARFFLKP